MEVESQSSIEAAHERRVPDELLQKLHAATERFHEAKKSLDEAMANSEYQHQQTIDRATDDMRAAEREVEEISLQIHSSLKPPPPASPNH